MHRARRGARSFAGRREVTYVVMLSALLVLVVSLVVILSNIELPARTESALAWTMPPTKEPAQNPPGYEDVVDDVPLVYASYFNLLKNVSDSPDDVPPGEPLFDFTFNDLAQNPSKFRGKPLVVIGRVLTVEPHRLQRGDEARLEAAGARLGEDFSPLAVYQTEIVVTDGGKVTAKYFLHTLDPPEHLAPGESVGFVGCFYSLYMGKILRLRTAGGGQSEEIARVIAPLLVGKIVRPEKPREYKEAGAAVDLSEYNVVDRGEVVASAAVASAARALEALSQKQREDLADTAATCFDMTNAPQKYRGHLVRLKGEVLSAEPAASEGEIAGFRRVVVAEGGGGMFRHFYAVYLAPSAPKVDKGAIIEVSGVFAQVISMEGTLTDKITVPLVVADNLVVTSAERADTGTYTGFLVLFIVLVALAFGAIAALVIAARRATR